MESVNVVYYCVALSLGGNQRIIILCRCSFIISCRDTHPLANHGTPAPENCLNARALEKVVTGERDHV